MRQGSRRSSSGGTTCSYRPRSRASSKSLDAASPSPLPAREPRRTQPRLKVRVAKESADSSGLTARKNEAVDGLWTIDDLIAQFGQPGGNQGGSGDKVKCRAGAPIRL